MIVRSSEERELFINIGRQYPELLKILTRMDMEELRKLPQATSKDQNVGVLQGRSQMLTEIKQLFMGRVE